MHSPGSGKENVAFGLVFIVDTFDIRDVNETGAF